MLSSHGNENNIVAPIPLPVHLKELDHVELPRPGILVTSDTHVTLYQGTIKTITFFMPPLSYYQAYQVQSRTDF